MSDIIVPGPQSYTDDEVARTLMAICDDMSTRFPGMIFAFVSSRPTEKGIEKIGLNTNLQSTQDAFEFFRMILANASGAKMGIVSDPETDTKDMS
jgi:hypothetical protein